MMLLLTALAALSSGQAPVGADFRAAQAAMGELRRKTERCELDRARGLLRVVGATEPAMSACLRRHRGRVGLTVLVTSPGGDVTHAMDAAEIVAEQGWSVRVLGLCGSSCGNYLIPAARRVEVAPWSVIGLHGCPDEAAVAEFRAGGRELVRRAGGPLRSAEWVDAQFRNAMGQMEQVHRRSEAFMQSFAVGPEWCRLSEHDAPGEGARKGAWFAVAGRAELARHTPRVHLGEVWEARTEQDRRAMRRLVGGHLAFGPGG